MKFLKKNIVICFVSIALLITVLFQKELSNILNYEAGSFEKIVVQNNFIPISAYQSFDVQKGTMNYVLSQKECEAFITKLLKLNLKSVISELKKQNAFRKASYTIMNEEVNNRLEITFYEENILSIYGGSKGRKFYYYSE